MNRLLLVALGGSVGAALRYLTSGAIHRYMDGAFPYGTLAVNVLGSLLLGFLWSLSEELFIPSSFRTSVMVGGIGAFTTFSTYSLETFNLMRYGDTAYALLNLLLNNGLGIAGVIVGFTLGKTGISLIRRGL